METFWHYELQNGETQTKSIVDICGNDRYKKKSTRQKPGNNTEVFA